MKNFKKSDLFSYLDGIKFVNMGEIELAISDFFREYVEENPDFQPSRGDLSYYSELAKEYIRTDEFDYLEDENDFLDTRSDTDFEDIDQLIYDYLTF